MKFILRSSLMIRFFVYSVVLLVFVTLSVGCKKYPEGPLISFHCKKQRVAGFYHVDKYLIDGADSTNEFIVIVNGNNSHHYQIIADKRRELAGGGCGGTWEFGFRKRTIKFGIGYNAPAQPYYVPNIFIIIGLSEWRILKLTDDEFWLKSNINGKEYEMHLKE